MAEQPTMEQMRARLRDADAMAAMERQFAELHARDCGFPCLADSESEDIHTNFAKAAMLIVRGMGNAGLRDYVSQSLSTGGTE